MRTNPDRFIEHVTDQSWVSYLNNMSQQSSWCDHLAVQAVSDALNVTIHITESHAQFEYYENLFFKTIILGYIRLLFRPVFLFSTSINRFVIARFPGVFFLFGWELGGGHGEEQKGARRIVGGKMPKRNLLSRSSLVSRLAPVHCTRGRLGPGKERRRQGTWLDS